MKINFKNICKAGLVIALFTLFTLPNSAQAQTFICDGEELCITLPTSVRGAIQWESSADMVTWTPVSGATMDTLCTTPAMEMWYRAEISEGDCDVLYSDTVHVMLHPAVMLTANADISVCDGSGDTLGGMASGGTAPFSYSWSPATGLSATNIVNPVATPAVNTTYWLTVTDSNGCTASDSQMVMVNDLPIVDAGVDTTINCSNGIVLGGSPTASGGAGGYSYLWDNAGVLSSATVANPNANPFATTTFTCTVTDTLGCMGSGSVVVTVTGAAVPGTQTFTFTGGVQMFIVPPCVDSLTLEAWGGQGGTGSTSTAGLGGYAKGDMAVSPGETLYVYVGGAGQNHNFNTAAIYEPLGGWNGGGKGGYDNSGQVEKGGGGGGASDVRRAADTTLTGRVIVGAGGGGAAGGFVATSTGGGGGGGTVGVTGGGVNQGIGGNGGTQSAGGLAPTTTRGATNGTFGIGGRGSTNQNAWGSGGGGGGYYGGGGGSSTVDHGSGYAGQGGGGSSYNTGLANPSTTSGIRTGNGQVVITW